MNEITIFDVGTFFIAGIALCLSVYNTIKQHYKRGAEVYLLKDIVNAEFFPHQRANTGHFDGSMRISLFFYNEGDMMSTVQFKSIKILNQDFEKCSNFNPPKITLPPQNSTLVQFDDFFFRNKREGRIEFPAQIKINVDFVFNKKKKPLLKSVEVPVNCEVKY